MVFKIKKNIIDKRILNTVKNALLIKPDEEILIIYTEDKYEFAKLFSNTCKEIRANVSLCLIEQKDVTNKEPPRPIAIAMKNSDIVLCITSISLTHTKAVTDAIKSGARIASMPGFTKKMLPALDINYNELSNICKRIGNLLNKTDNITIKTEIGTDLTLYRGKRRAKIDDGIFDKKGSLHNIPSGECCIAPIEDSASGIAIIDACMVGIEKIKYPIYITIKDGKITKIEGHYEAKKLNEILLKSDENSKTLCEFSLGLNEKARLIGNVLNDEKALGTCHIAFGDNINIGGKNRSNVHLDGVIKKPTIMFDDEIIMKNGIFRWRW
ncbi:MAG: aminopeptidase [Candidatus Aenigmatarchaeota archaeon]